uniref:NADH-ubiquinone oxidoreductase chain 2 n=1 Tax=Prionospio sp. 6 MH-2023 TaxID=3059274 RepID=A0AAU6QGG5_9ANNE
MMLYPFMHLFILTLFTSTIMALSSYQWLMVWMSLELNMLSFIPMISSSNWFQESEASLKYLLFQALGSSLLLLAAINQSLSFLILLGLTMKLGLAPFHFWFPSVMKSMSWPVALLLLTWQKIAPMALLFSMFSSYLYLLSLIATTSAIVGGLGGMVQSQLRPMLAYSSIGHMGWMLAIAPHSPSISFTYLFTYIAISVPIIWSSLLSKIDSTKKKSPSYTLSLFILFPLIISLSGLPPLTGFVPKLLVIMFLPSFLIMLTLILGSLINLSYYLNFFFTLIMSSVSSKKEGESPRYMWALSALSVLATSPLSFLLLLSFLL